MQDAPRRPHGSRLLTLAFVASIAFGVAWRVTRVSAIGSLAAVAFISTVVISLYNRRHFRAYRQEIREYGQRARRDKNGGR